MKSLDRKQRFDANKGLHIDAVRVATDKEGDKEEVTASAASAGSK